MAETLTKHKIEQLAPDQAALGAALKLMKLASWPMRARLTPLCCGGNARDRAQYPTG
jgi:hypothetical protein